MIKDGFWRGRQEWRCKIHRSELSRRYYAANGARVRSRTRENKVARRVRFGTGGLVWEVYVDNKEEVTAARDAFRAKQQQDYKEAADGGFN